jgi:FkbM family methyltransferase
MMEERYVEEIGRAVFLRPERATDELVYESTFVNRYHVPPADITPRRVLDLGANIGFTLVHYRALWPDAKIIGVEMALDHVAMSHLNSDVPVLPVAVGVENRVGRFEHTGTWGTTHHLSESGNMECDIWTIRKIVQVCFDGQQIDFVKMDVEGTEWELFARPEWILYVRSLLVELHDGEPDELKERGLRALNALGYDVTVHETHPHAIWATR